MDGVAQLVEDLDAHGIDRTSQFGQLGGVQLRHGMEELTVAHRAHRVHQLVEWGDDPAPHQHQPGHGHGHQADQADGQHDGQQLEGATQLGPE